MKIKNQIKKNRKIFKLGILTGVISFGIVLIIYKILMLDIERFLVVIGIGAIAFVITYFINFLLKR